MLKFLTHKLRTHSINEENYNQKGDEDHDSGTESDEEIDPLDLPSPAVSDRMCSVSPADTGCSMESPAPDTHDPHSSEEELEVINSNPKCDRTTPLPLRAASVCLPEKRKWSQMGDHHRYRPENEENMSHYSNLSPPSSCSPYLKSYGDDGHVIEHSGSSDDEVHNLLASRATPVRFRTSPPLEAVKPGRRTLLNKGRSISPPSKLLHYDVSPRKRSKYVRYTHLQRPYLDFEKMQQTPIAVRNKAQMSLIMNYVGKLNEYCSINRKLFPYYAEHYPEFQGRFCMICTYQDHTTKGYGITKKYAKQDSARQMLEIIKENKDVLDQGQEKTTRKFETDPELYDIILKKNSELKGSLDMGEPYENNNEARSSDVKVDISTRDELTELLKARNLNYGQHNPLIFSSKLVLILTGKSEEDIKEKFDRKDLEK